MKHLVLVDGHHLMYRAFYAIPATLKTSNGEQTNAVYGVASMLISLLKSEEPDSLLFCFDAGEETFRHQENATYKEGRAETPDEFYSGQTLRAFNERIYNSDMGAVWGIKTHDFAAQNAFRDTVDLGTTSEFRIVETVQAGVALTNPALEIVSESIFSAGAGG